MDPTKFRLLIHHHAVAFVAESGDIWLPAGIARWVSAISPYFKEIHLLLHQSTGHAKIQDTAITEKNVKLISLGTPGHYWDRIHRMRRIRETCRQAGVQADGLLIRGLTPRQYIVWLETPVPQKAFLLIRSPKQNRITKLSLMDIVSAIINRQREQEFSQIASKNTLLMANSPVHLPTLEKLSGKKAFFVPTGTIRKSEFAPLQFRPVSEPIKLFFCGRLHFLKGLRELFSAMSILWQQGYHCELDLIGALEEPAYSQLLGLAGQLGIVKQIHWHGFVPFGQKLLNFYRTADLFVLPSYTEGFPRVFWEAAANCCPVIITSVGGIPALLVNEQHALLIPPKDAQAIVMAIKHLLSDDSLRQHLVEQAYRLAQGFTVEACAQAISEILTTEWN